MLWKLSYIFQALRNCFRAVKELRTNQNQENRDDMDIVLITLDENLLDAFDRTQQCMTENKHYSAPRGQESNISTSHTVKRKTMKTQWISSDKGG